MKNHDFPRPSARKKEKALSLANTVLRAGAACIALQVLTEEEPGMGAFAAEGTERKWQMKRKVPPGYPTPLRTDALAIKA